MARPTIIPAILATITEDAPARVRRKLDREPGAAEKWDWNQCGDDWTVETGSETVRLTAVDGVITLVENVGCTCLLSPRCYHLLSCLSVLELSVLDLSEPEATDSDAASEPLSDDDGTETSTELDANQTKAVLRLFDEIAKLLAVGVRSAGSLIQAQLMRAVHECRSVGLHRLAAAGLRVLQQVRQFRSSDDHFDSTTLIADLAESLELAWRLTNSDQTDTEWIGTARRPYFPVQSLSLQALLTEPVLTASGHAGVVTYLIDQAGEMYSISNVRPGEPSRVFDAWQNGIDVGGLSVTHQELSRSGLLLQRGTASQDGRLGAGQDSRAITKKGNDWADTAVERSFSRDLDDQIARVFESSRSTLISRRAGWDFLFLRGQVVGTDGQSLIFQTHDQRPLFLDVSQHHDALAFRHNMELLSRCPGLSLQVIGRLNTDRAHRVSALAISADTRSDHSESDGGESASELCLPDDWKNVVSLGLEKLARKHVTSAEREPVHLSVTTTGTPDDGLAPLRRRIRELALSGRHSLPTRSIGSLARESQLLANQSRPTAAALLQNLASVAVESESNLSGQRFPSDPTPLARLWLACTHYTSSGTAEFQQSLWQNRE